MRLSIQEFFALLHHGMSLRGRNGYCGVVRVEKRKGKTFLKMHWPDPDPQQTHIDEYGDFIPPPKQPVERIPLDKFEYFAKRLFDGIVFDIDVEPPKKEKP